MTDIRTSDRRRDQFATTHWSLVLAAGQRSSPDSRRALATLCEQYWYPAYAFIRRQGFSADEAADLTQDFFSRVLEKSYFAQVDPARGRFRSFLLACLRHFLSNERDRARTLKRGGEHPPISLELETAEGRYQIEPRDELTPEKIFDRRWALMMLDRVLSRLRDEQITAGKATAFDTLKVFLTGEAGALRYAVIARTLDMSEGAVKVAVHRLRRRFRDLLMDEIAHTVSDPGDIDGEIRHLLKAVSV